MACGLFLILHHVLCVLATDPGTSTECTETPVCDEPGHYMDLDRLTAMLEELNQFERNKFWSLVKSPDPKKHNIIGTKWIFCNKQDEYGIVVRNKARLVEQGYTQIEAIDFGETFAPV